MFEKYLIHKYDVFILRSSSFWMYSCLQQSIKIEMSTNITNHDIQLFNVPVHESIA